MGAIGVSAEGGQGRAQGCEFAAFEEATAGKTLVLVVQGRTLSSRLAGQCIDTRSILKEGRTIQMNRPHQLLGGGTFFSGRGRGLSGTTSMPWYPTVWCGRGGELGANGGRMGTNDVLYSF